MVDSFQKIKNNKIEHKNNLKHNSAPYANR